MKIPDSHKEYLKTKGIIGVTNVSMLSTEENNLLYEYCHWLNALANETIEPFTEAQREFVLFTQNPSNPQSEFELAWLSFIEAQRLSRMANEVNSQLSGNIRAIQPGDSLDDWWSKER